MTVYTDISVDIETLGTKPGSVVLSIGAVPFNLERVSSNGLIVAPSIMEQLIVGLEADVNTLAWWGKQSPEARERVRQTPTVEPLKALLMLQDLVEECCTSDVRVWMKGPSFDGVHLAALADAVGGELPWRYWQERCVRTICDGVTEPERGDVQHCAYDDALHQAKWVRDALLCKQVLPVETIDSEEVAHA